MTTPTDRLTEIKARVAAAKADRLLNGPLVTFDDVEFVLGEIERLQRERDLFFASVNEIGAERDRLLGELDAIKRTREQEADYANICYANEKLVNQDQVHWRTRRSLIAERDRLSGLLKIAFSAWMRGPDGHIAQDDVNAISAALEGSK